jgi:hypothetical protein
VKEKISSNVTDIEIMSLLAKIKYETIDWTGKKEFPLVLRECHVF